MWDELLRHASRSLQTCPSSDFVRFILLISQLRDVNAMQV